MPRKRAQSEEFDPFQIFSPEPEPCYLLKVTVVKGIEISKGWASDLMDTPDPYVTLELLNTPNEVKKTSVKENDQNPVWNETFQFVMDFHHQYSLEVCLMEKNLTVDQSYGTKTIDMSSLPLNDSKAFTLTFKHSSKLVLSLYLVEDKEQDLRYSLMLCEEEKAFIKKRLKRIVKIMRDKYGEQNGPENEVQVPNIAILGSGGGFRALTGCSGAFKALVECGIFDMALYVAGLSGSAWYLSTLYSHPKFPCINFEDFNNELRLNISKSPFWLLSPRNLLKYDSAISEKKKNGQYASFTDFFGHMIGDTLLKGHKDDKLTQQQGKLVEARVPLPLYSCLHVKQDILSEEFHEWLEFSPFEVGFNKYATYMKASLFGSKFYKGRVIRQYPELPMHFLQGMWGSAFTILCRKLLQESMTESIDNMEEEESELNEEKLHKDIERVLTSSGVSGASSDDEDSGEDGESRETVNGNSETSHCHKGERHGIDRSKMQNTSSLIQFICNSKILNTRKGRAACVHNPLRHLKFNSVVPLSPFSIFPQEKDIIKHQRNLQPKKIYLVDGGLQLNIPFPPLLRPQRKIDMYIIIDYGTRDKDTEYPFKALLASENWARSNNCPFPPIPELIKPHLKEPIQECYYFKHPTDPFCPTIVYFPIINKDFRQYKQPGVPRETKEETDFANFEIFSDPKSPYSIFNFKYTHSQFDRMSQLMEFNVKNNVSTVHKAIQDVIQRKRIYRPKVPITLNRIQNLSVKINTKEIEEFSEYINKLSIS